MIFIFVTRRAIFAAITLISFAVSAQNVLEGSQNSNATRFSTPYKSVFSDYKSYQDPEVQAWQKSNADVSHSDSMHASSMGGMKGMSDKSTDNMKAKIPASVGKNAILPSDEMQSSMPAHGGMPSR